jgi:hypothetical protein
MPDVFAFTILIRTRTYGSSPECNRNAVAGPFSALNTGRITGWIVTVIFVVFYIIITCMDYLPPNGYRSGFARSEFGDVRIPHNTVY